MRTAFSPLALYLFTPLPLAAVSDVEDVIVVTGDNRNAQQQASSSVSVSRETMEQQGSLTVVDALQHVPGIQLRYGGQGVPQLDIRGYKSRDITFLVNGVPQNSAWDSQFDPQLIPVGMIERIDITKGGSGSLLYGSGGFGGVINVITRQSDGEPHSALAVGAGNGGHYTANASTSGAAGALDYAASYAYDGKDGFPMAADFTPSGQQGDGRRNNSDNRNHTLATSLNWQASEDTRLGLNLNYRHDSWGVPDKLGGSGNGNGGGGGGGGKGNAKAGGSAGGGNGPAWSDMRVEPLEHYDVQTTFSHQLTDSNTMRGYAWYSHETRDNQYRGKSADRQQRTRTESYGSNLQWINQLSRQHTLTNGITLSEDRWRCNGDDCDAQQNRQSIAQQDWVAEYQFQPDDTLGLTLSGALYHNDRAGGTDYAAQAAGYWYPWHDTRLFTTAARRIRFPDLSQLYDIEYGNSTLVPETSHYFEAGFEQALFNRVQLRLSAWVSDVYHHIEKSALTDRFTNFDHYRFWGIEPGVHYFISEDTDLSLGYAWLKAENKGDDSTRSALQGRPTHSAWLALNTRLPLDLSASVRVESFRDSVQYQGQSETPVKLDNYTLVGLSLSGPSPWAPLSWQFTVNNLFDENYAQALNFPRPGREYLLQLKMNF